MTNVEFQQAGYSLSLELGHPTTVGIQLADSGEGPRDFNLVAGPNRFCLRKPGVYHIVPQGCIKYDKPSYEFVTAAPQPLFLHAVAYQVRGELHFGGAGEAAPSNVQVTVSEAGTGHSEVLIPQPSSTTVYTYQYFAPVGATLEFTPTAQGLLFYPRTRSVTVERPECPVTVAPMTGRPGMYIRGTITPAVSGVQVSVRDAQSSETVGEALSDESGQYAVGPLYDDREYILVRSCFVYSFVL